MVRRTKTKRVRAKRPPQVSELTFNSAREYIRKLGMALVKTGYDDELRVRFVGDPPGHGYFTDDLVDAVQTAKAMYAQRQRMHDAPARHGRFVN